MCPEVDRYGGAQGNGSNKDIDCSCGHLELGVKQLNSGVKWGPGPRCSTNFWSWKLFPSLPVPGIVDTIVRCLPLLLSGPHQGSWVWVQRELPGQVGSERQGCWASLCAASWVKQCCFWVRRHLVATSQPQSRIAAIYRTRQHWDASSDAGGFSLTPVQGHFFPFRMKVLVQGILWETALKLGTLLENSGLLVTFNWKGASGSLSPVPDITDNDACSLLHKCIELHVKGS